MFLADKFDSVVSSDINPKAVRYAKFNAILNKLEKKIENIESDLFTQLVGRKFDFICWNGPTVAMPEVECPKNVYPLYAYGGYDGAEFTKKFLSEVLQFVKSTFEIRWWDGSLGDSRRSVSEKYIQKHLSHLPIKVTIQFLNRNRGVSIKKYDKFYIKYCLNRFDLNQSNFSRQLDVQSWYQKLKDQNLTHTYISLISIKSSDKFEIVHVDTDKTIVGPRQVLGFEWHLVSRNFIRDYLHAHNSL